jgi:hypothetical protein
VRLNFLAYFLVALLILLSSAIDGLMRQPNTYYRANGVVLITAVAILVVLPLIWWRGAARRREIANKLVVPA